ncbi:MAG: hydrolase [Oscillospiraceae bacterium]|nr:hydrolase [Oscillospiraceae bacterium]
MQTLIGRGKRNVADQKKYPCPVCGSRSLSEPTGSFDICPICGWEDDYAGQSDPDGLTINGITLNTARKAWANGETLFPRYPNPNAKKD